MHHVSTMYLTVTLLTTIYYVAFSIHTAQYFGQYVMSVQCVHFSMTTWTSVHQAASNVMNRSSDTHLDTSCSRDHMLTACVSLPVLRRLNPLRSSAYDA